MLLALDVLFVTCFHMLSCDPVLPEKVGSTLLQYNYNQLYVYASSHLFHKCYYRLSYNGKSFSDG